MKFKLNSFLDSNTKYGNYFQTEMISEKSIEEDRLILPRDYDGPSIDFHLYDPFVMPVMPTT